MENMKLNNGYMIPEIGYGTWQSPDSEVTVNGVKAAIACGYRHIDTAAAYKNEESVGEGIKESGIARKDLFVTSKVWNTQRGYEKTIAAFEKTLSDLDLDYLDLYLIHWPASKKDYENWEEINLETWRAMTDLYKAGKIKAIGVSNFSTGRLADFALQTPVIPTVNQIELHPYKQHKLIQKADKEFGTLTQAWAPFHRGEDGIF